MNYSQKLSSKQKLHIDTQMKAFVWMDKREEIIPVRENVQRLFGGRKHGKFLEPKGVSSSEEQLLRVYSVRMDRWRAFLAK